MGWRAPNPPLALAILREITSQHSSQHKITIWKQSSNSPLIVGEAVTVQFFAKKTLYLINGESFKEHAFIGENKKVKFPGSHQTP